MSVFSVNTAGEAVDTKREYRAMGMVAVVVMRDTRIEVWVWGGVQ